MTGLGGLLRDGSLHPGAVTGDADRPLYLALLALLVWAPLPLGSNRPWSWALMQAWILVIGALWLWGAARGRWSVTPALRRARWVLVLLGAWVLWGLVQMIPMPAQLLTLLSPGAAETYAGAGVIGWAPITLDRHASLIVWVGGVGYLTLFCLILLLVQGRRRLYAFASVLVLAALGQAMFASMLALSGGRLWAGAAESYAHGSFPNRNHLAGFLAMSIALGIGLLMAGLDPDGAGLSWRQRLRNLTRTLLGHKARLRIYLAIMVVTLVLTGSRMGNTAFFASLLGASLLALLFYRRLPRSALVLLVSLVLVDLFILGSWFGLDRVRERLEKTVLTQEERYHVDVHGLGYLDDFWVTGSGGGTFAVVFPAYRDQGLSPNFFAHAHNDYLESVLEYGVLGLVLPGAVVALSLGAALRVLYRRRDPLPRGMAFASLMGVMAILIHSTADFNLHIPANAALFVVLLALPWLGLAGGHRQSGHG
jgi:O-antigen ligase